MNFLKKRAAARAQPELAEHVSQCARSAELTESDRQALFHTPPVYTRDCPDCGTRFESQCARSAKCPQCLSLSLSLSLNALEAQSTAAESAPNTTQGEGGDSPLSSAQSSGVAAEADDGAADPFAELASWTTADLVQWIGDRHDNGAALAALDEACQALPDDVRPEVEKRITEAYTWLARKTLADIAEAKQAAKAERPGAIIHFYLLFSNADWLRWIRKWVERGNAFDAYKLSARLCKLLAEKEVWLCEQLTARLESVSSLVERSGCLGSDADNEIDEDQDRAADLENARAVLPGIVYRWQKSRPNAEELARLMWDELEDTIYTSASNELVALAEAALAELVQEGQIAKGETSWWKPGTLWDAEPDNGEPDAAPTSPVTEEAADDDDLTEEKAAIIEALTRWQESVPEGDELLELVQVRRPGYFALEDLGAALVELQQANVLAVDRTGGWYLTGDATPAEQGPVVTMVPVSTGTVIAHIRHDGAERYTLQSGAYKLDIVLPADYAEVTKLLMALLAAVSMRLEGFQEGPAAHVLTHKAWRAVMAALALVTDDEPARCYAVDTPGPGGACHKFECAGITVQFQRGARGEPDSVAGVLAPDLLEVCKHVLYQRETPYDFELIALCCIELAINKLTERVTERIGRGVFGRHAA